VRKDAQQKALRDLEIKKAELAKAEERKEINAVRRTTITIKHLVSDIHYLVDCPRRSIPTTLSYLHHWPKRCLINFFSSNTLYQ